MHGQPHIRSTKGTFLKTNNALTAHVQHTPAGLSNESIVFSVRYEVNLNIDPTKRAFLWSSSG